MRYKILCINQRGEWEAIAEFVNCLDRDSCFVQLQNEWPSRQFTVPETLERVKEDDERRKRNVAMNAP